MASRIQNVRSFNETAKLATYFRTLRSNPTDLKTALEATPAAKLARVSSYFALAIGYTGGRKAEHVEALLAYFAR